MPAMPPMTATHHTDGPDVIVTITHDPRQSYSRAVGPYATRRANVVLPPGRWALAGVDWDAPAPAGRAATAYRYTRA